MVGSNRIELEVGSAVSLVREEVVGTGTELDGGRVAVSILRIED